MDNPNSSVSVYEQIAATIGDVCIWWSQIDDIILGLSLHMASVIDPEAFDSERAWEVLAISLSNMDDRARISNAKTLAHFVECDLSPDFYRRTEELLNFVDNVIRPERNRYVHDAWSVGADQSIRRFKTGSVVTKPQSRRREVVTYVQAHFSGVDDFRNFIGALSDVRNDLVTLDGHLAWLASQKKQPSKFVQPLPQEWPSFAHRGWLTRDKRPPRT